MNRTKEKPTKAVKPVKIEKTEKPKKPAVSNGVLDHRIAGNEVKMM